MDAKNIKKIRFNIYLSKMLREYLDVKAEECGMSASSYVNLLIANDKKQAEAINMYSNMEKLLKLQEKLGKEESQ